MAYKIKDKEKFVELRAEGLSFDNISKAYLILKIKDEVDLISITY